MTKELFGILTDIKKIAQDMMGIIADEVFDDEQIKSRISVFSQAIDMMKAQIPEIIYSTYEEFFLSFKTFCGQCNEIEFLIKNRDMMISSLDLFIECLETIEEEYKARSKKCVCCNQEVIYTPIPSYYADMRKALGVGTVFINETLNRDEYLCPVCGASDRDRLIISFLKKAGIQQATEGTKLLQFAPAPNITNWIVGNCPQIDYNTTDLFMENVTYQSDIQNMEMVKDDTYDIVICSHVLEHVQDDRKAMREMKRILKPNGKIIFLVPVDLSVEIIDEEWGLSEQENWNRFGQGDHCRRYSKAGLIERLQECFYVHELGKEYFGEEIFSQCGLTDTSTLYVLTQDECVDLDFAEKIEIDQDLCQNGPLVSVIMSCYNHGAFVADAIESVLNQSYKNIEFLVADDASTDNSVEIMQRYSYRFAKELYFSENAGGRFQELKQYATGKYIALMNSDDVWELDKIALQVKYMEEHEECGVCFTWCDYVDENLVELDNNIFKQKNRSSHEWMRFFWEKGNVLCNPSSLLKREFSLLTPQYGSCCWQLPDFFKWIDLVQRCSIYILPKSMTKMRRYNKNGVTNVSAVSKGNLIRHSVEEGCNWLWVVRDMDTEFFKKTFGDRFINAQASTEQEIKCEKYFLMLNHHSIFVQNSALCYLADIYNEVKECLVSKYQYGMATVKEDMIKKGFGQAVQ